MIGFGLGLLCAPVIYMIYPELVPGPMIMNALLITSILSVKHRAKIDFHQTGFSIMGGTAGVLVAGVVMLFIDSHQYQLLFGISILVAVALSLVGIAPRVSIISNLIASMLSGFLGTTTSAGGAPMGLLYQTVQKEKIKANLSIFFTYINLFAIIVLSLAGVIGFSDFVLFLYCIPALLVGWILAIYINRRINEKLIRTLILTIASLSGLMLVIFRG